MNIMLSDVSGVYGFQLDLEYNSSFFEAIKVFNGTFLSNFDQNTIYCLQPDLSKPGLIKNIVCSIIGSSGSTPNSGVLATIVFKVKSINNYPAASRFVISNLKLSDINSNPLDNSKLDGEVSVHCDNASCSSCTCIPSWDCDEWSVCSEGSQTRRCYDLNSCGVDDGKPIEYRTCTIATTSGGGGGGGEGAASSTSSFCIESWSCDDWAACDSDGFRRRTCVDKNNCSSYNFKPIEIETCVYKGSCSDGIMNPQEEGIDCGGVCPNTCPTPETDIQKINLIIEPITAEILDQYKLKVIVENLGTQELSNIEVSSSKWGVSSSIVKNILPGLKEQTEILLNLPVSSEDSSVSIQALIDGVVVASKDVPVSLSIPEYSLKINHDLKAQRTYQVVIIDNRGKSARSVQVDYVVMKGKETYFMESGKIYQIDADSLFHHIDYLYTSLPTGNYDVKAVFYEKGQKISESVSKLTIGGTKKALNVKYLFYAFLIIIVSVCGYMFFKSQKKNSFN